MLPEERLDFLRRTTEERHVFVPPFTFGERKVASDLSAVQTEWAKARDRSLAVGTTSLYVHVPFCRGRRCSFCMYASSTDCSPAKLEEYADRIAAEMDLWRSQFPPVIQNLYVGGGTPSVYSPHGLSRLLKPFVGFSYAENGERTCEMSPATANVEHVDAAHDAGINRLSMGVQSFDPSVLAAASRRFVSDSHIRSLCGRARELAFVDVNLDLMLGLPGITGDNLLDSVRKTIDSGALSATVYYWRQTPVSRERLAEEFAIVKNEMLRLGWTLESGSADTEHHLFYSPQRRRGTTRLVTHANCVDNQRVIGIGLHAHGFRSGLSYTNEISPRHSYWAMNEDQQIRMAIASFLYFGNGHLTRRAFHRIFDIELEDYFRDELSDLRKLGAIKESADSITLNGRDAVERSALQKFFWDQDYLQREYGGAR